MALNQPQRYLIAYDIADPRRLGRVHRFLRQQGLPVQYSVFTAQLTERKLQRVLAGLASIIAPGADDVRCYPLPAKLDSTTLGLQMFPDDVMLLSDGGINLLVR
jgi:CRISPR-associated protein Cas2